MYQQDERLRKVQLMEFELLKKVKEICEENDITYYLSGGTLLGAVRHKGFIPWDDDVDIAMPRPDYERFVLIARDRFSKPWSLKEKDLDPEYLHPFVKIYDERVQMQTSTSELGNTEYLWIDVFPLDAMPGNRLYFFWRKYHILYRRMMYVFSVFRETADLTVVNRPWYEKLLMFLADKLDIERFLDPRRQLDKFQKVLAAYPFEKGRYVINLVGRYKFKSVMEKSIYGRKTELLFEGTAFRVPEMYDEYLRRIYGDYMRLPPEDQRNHHGLDMIRFVGTEE